MTLRRIGIALALLVVVLGGIVAALNFRGEDTIPADEPPFSPTAEQVTRGEYLTRVGNCLTCHTARGGEPYAGGLAMRTPFGTVYSTNITPDAKTGIGAWRPSHFWRALHNGRSKDGRLLYPAFPYPSYTQVTRDDADAMFAYLRSIPAVPRVSRPHELRFPYDSQVALAVWRALFFQPETFTPERSKAPEWNRGAYLVHGLGHCVACHSPRNALGATREKLELSGGVIPMQGWYAPSLTSPAEAGVADWETEHVVSLLRTGVSPRASVMGPMADVVYRSTQFWSEEDLRAIAVYLKALPQSSSGRDEGGWFSWFGGRRDGGPGSPEVRATGGNIYTRSCADCHGENGEGAQGAYPALAGNRAVTMGIASNVIRVVLSGGYLPATAGNPRPFGMPPFAHVMNDAEIAAVITYIRGAWGNSAPAVTQLQVMRLRAGESR